MDTDGCLSEDMVQEFIEAMNLDDKDASFWDRLVVEEMKEFVKEACDLVYVMRGLVASDAYGQVDVDFIEAVLGAFVNKHTNLKWEDVFERVHESNMSKLGDDGKPVVDGETGKILKGPYYQKPDFSDLEVYI